MKQNFTVRQGALDGVEAFLSVAQHRSFRRAAAELEVTPSAISQAVRALEGRVGAALFLRTTRSVGMTEAGERFLSRAKPAFEELVAASEVARKLGERPAGRLRLSVPRAVVPILLEPLIASFCQAYPEVEVEIAASEELVDLVFLILWADGRLPWQFALPAGIGDVLTGCFAVVVAAQLAQKAPGALRAAYGWYVFGIADLVVAVTMGGMTSPGRIHLLAFDAPNLLISSYPLVMVPTFAVPLALMLHGLVLWRLRRESAWTGRLAAA